jgi:hypothetical protein
MTPVGGTGDAAWCSRIRQHNVGLTLNEWLQKHQKHNNNSIIKQDILHNIYHFNIVSHIFEVDKSICCSPPYLWYKNSPGLDRIRGVQNNGFYGGTYVPRPHFPSHGQNIPGLTPTHGPFLPTSIDLLSPVDEDNNSINTNFIQSPLNNNDDPTPTLIYPSPFCNVGCQTNSPRSTPITVYKEAKKLTLPSFDPAKMSWTSFAMKLHASLIECEMSY